MTLPCHLHASWCIGNSCKRTEKIPIIMYHHVRVDTNIHDPLGVRLSLSPSLFADQLDALIKAGFTAITFRDLTATGAELPVKPVLLTFDDGYDDAVVAALPELKRRGMTATFFIISGKVGRGGYVSLDQLQQLKDAGMELGVHTVSHPDLARLPLKKQRKEIVDSVNFLRDALGVHVYSFAYPMGKYGLSTVDLVKDAGIAYAVTTHHGLAHLDGNPLLLRRIRSLSTMDGRRLIRDVLDAK